MPTRVIMPQLGESVAEGTVIRWLKKVGDKVERDEPLFEISTDKVDAEIPSPAAGTLTKILVKENQTVEVNAVVAEINGEGPVTAGVSVPAHEAAPHPSGVPAPPRDHEPAASPAGAPLIAPAPSASAEGAGPKIRSSPLVRRIAKEKHVDLALVKGTGQGGRISKEDILKYVAGRSAAAATTGSVTPAAPPPVKGPSPIAFSRQVQVVPMTPMRKQIAEHMILSRRTSAHVTTVFEVEMTCIAETRAQYAVEFERRHGLKLTYTPFFAKAAIEAIKQFPIINASVEGDNIVYERDVNIGMAVALDTGLIVPVLRHADEKSFLGLARAVTDLAERARSKRLSVDEVQGGTFTITNPGVFGSLFGTPIINQPQVAILGVGAIEKRAVVRNDAIAIRPMVYLVLSFDHRVIDGAVADQFMAKIKASLENWSEAVQ